MAADVMDEREYPLIQITSDDIAEANRLSLACPICGSGVENNAGNGALTPIVCEKCGTLYHRACWEQGGGKCAVLGCGHEKYYVYGRQLGPILRVKYTDLPAPSAVPGANGRDPGRRNRELKERQKREVERYRRPSLWSRFMRWLLEQIRINMD
jgi:hypothetical protein